VNVDNAARYRDLVLADANDQGADVLTLGRHLLALALCLEHGAKNADANCAELRERVAFQLRILAVEAKNLADKKHRDDFRSRVVELVETSSKLSARDTSY
jgi:hypothetical protein